MPKQQWGKNSSYNKLWCDNLISTCKRMNLDHHIKPKINSKWFKDLKLKGKIIKL